MWCWNTIASCWALCLLVRCTGMVRAQAVLAMAANAADDQLILAPDPEVTTTMTHRSITTKYRLVTTTTTLTRFVHNSSTAVPSPVQVWYETNHVQQSEGCDKDACASCRSWYNCEGGESRWCVSGLDTTHT